MTWVKLDDGFADHPKVLKAGPAAAWVYVQGLCYASRHLTDGFIPEQAALRMGPVPDIGRLLAVALWEKVDDGFQVHDYAAYQPTREKVLRERQGWQERQARSRTGRKEQGLIGAESQAIILSRRDIAVTSSEGSLSRRDSPRPVPVPVSNITTLSKPRENGDRPREPFRIPSFDELSAYIAQKHYSVDPSTFLAFYDSNGWKVGKNPMRSWKGALYTWHSRPR